MYHVPPHVSMYKILNVLWHSNASIREFFFESCQVDIVKNSFSVSLDFFSMKFDRLLLFII